MPRGFRRTLRGFLTRKEKFLRQMPGRLVGQTVDTEGRRGFVLTLATREQHIRREKATSNICTNQSLCALAVTIYLSLLGKTRTGVLAEQNLAKAHYAASNFAASPASRSLRRSVLQRVRGQDAGRRRRSCSPNCRSRRSSAASLEQFYPEMKNHLLVCVTETVSREAIDRVVEASAAVAGRQRPRLERGADLSAPGQRAEG